MDSIDETKSLVPGNGSDSEEASYLIIVDGASSSRRALPRDGVLLVGRVPEADLRFNTASISRRHGRFILTGGEARVTDLESHNGTRVNGERIEGARSLLSGDVVTMGDVTFILRGDSRPPSRRMLGFPDLRQRLGDEIERALDHGRPLSLLVLSLGDAARDRAAARAAADLRPSDILGWAGAAQLAVLLPELGIGAARAFGQGLVQGLSAFAPEVKGGLACCPADGCDPDALLSGARAAADAAHAGDLRAAFETATEHALGDRTLVIADPAMLRIFDLVRRLAATDLAVLVSGETGAGKENVALAVHHWSRRASKPMITINCATIPETLVESELFGHEPGAFSDARTAKPGLLERASGGTVFLDEVGELPEKAQAKLLRALEAKRIMRLGDVREREVDLRIVAASNRDLEALCREGRFREDLLFRLGGAAVHLPPLRDRPREVTILARRFLGDACVRAGRAPVGLSDDVLERLSTYPWPGNVRELKSAMEYAAATLDGPEVTLWDLPERMRVARESSPEPREEAPPPRKPPSSRASLAEEMRQLERARLVEALDAAGGVQRHAAALIGMPLRTLVYKLRQHGLTAKELRRRP
jgi:two-component system, NtrC family, response regulator AtoC